MSVRIWNRLRRDGPVETARTAALRIRKLAYLREEHVWYQCDLDEQRPRRDLPEGVRLVSADVCQVDALASFGRDPEEARQCLAGGNDVWLAFEGDQPLFACFTFLHAAPVMAASGGTLSLPPGAACLEDSVTSPAARGRGIAPAAWTLIGDELERRGFRAIVTKIETSNTASRRAVEKVGFRSVAVMQHKRVGPRRRTSVEAVGSGLGSELAARLS